MATFHSSWLIGSVRDLPAQTFEADGVEAVVAAGNYYLQSPVSAMTLLVAFRQALLDAGVADVTAVLTQSRHVRLTASESFTVEWGAATQLRDLLGFDDDLPNLAAHQATLVSPLLWSPATKLASQLSPQLTTGIRRHQSYYAVSPSDGATTVVTHGSRLFQRLTAINIANERMFTLDELGGEYVKFFDTVLAQGGSLYFFPDVVEDASPSTTSVTLLPYLGPYVLSPSGRAATWVYDRSKGFEWTDRRQDITIDLHVPPQYPT